MFVCSRRILLPERSHAPGSIALVVARSVVIGYQTNSAVHVCILYMNARAYSFVPTFIFPFFINFTHLGHTNSHYLEAHSSLFVSSQSSLLSSFHPSLLSSLQQSYTSQNHSFHTSRHSPLSSFVHFEHKRHVRTNPTSCQGRPGTPF